MGRLKKESRTKAVKAQLLSIPLDLVADILTKLPVKSLLRFRCVCKLWCSLIFDPQFIKSQTNASNNNNHPKFLLFKGDSAGSTQCNATKKGGSESLHTIGYKASVPKFEFGDISFNKKGFNQILGSCNGLLVIASFRKKEARLWNPSTREDKRVLNFPSYFCYSYNLWGLGFDSYSDEYKLVMASRFSSRTYSFRTNSWKSGQGFDYDSNIIDNFFLFLLQDRKRQLATLVNGTPHWIVQTRCIVDFTSSHLIYFDFLEEKFQEVVLPHESSKYAKFELGVMGGCLCVAVNDDKSHAAIWMMKDYGVKESWTKLFVIPREFHYFKPLCFTEDGKVLLQIIQMGNEYNRVVVCDPNKGESEPLVILRLKQAFKLAPYVESLNSPKALVHGTKRKRS